MNWIEKVMAKLAILKELWLFMRYRKRWWMTPIIIVLGLLGVLVVFAETSALAPFIYSLF